MLAPRIGLLQARPPTEHADERVGRSGDDQTAVESPIVAVAHVRSCCGPEPSSETVAAVSEE